MDLKEFLLSYRDGVRAKTGKVLSRRAVVENIFKKDEESIEELRKIQKKYEKWEEGAGKPKDESDRMSIKLYFGIEDFENIKPQVLEDAINRYPLPFSEMGGINNLPLINKNVKPDENQENKQKDALNSENNLPPLTSLNKNDMQTLIKTLEFTMRHLVERGNKDAETIAMMASKFPNIESSEERTQLKTGRTAR